MINQRGNGVNRNGSRSSEQLSCVEVDASRFPTWQTLEFYDGAKKLGTIVAAPTQFTATNLTPGYHVFSVLGTDALIEFNEIHHICLPPVYNMGADYTGRDPSSQSTIMRWMGYMNDSLQVLRLRKIINVLQPPYIIRYPRLMHIFEENPELPRCNIVHDNLSLRSGDFGDGRNDARGNWVTSEDPGFVNAAALNFQLSEDSPVWSKIPGFQLIPFEQIGLSDSMRIHAARRFRRRHCAGSGV